MRLIVGSYEIEIKAKKVWHNKFNKADTMALLNSVSLHLSDLAKLMRKYDNTIYADDIADIRDNESKEIYAFLDGKGCYDKYKR